MFEITAPSANRIDIKFSGKLNAEQMKTGLDDLIEKSEGIKNGRMLYTIKKFDFPTFGAIGVELIRLPKLFKLISRFDRAAVLAEQEWVQKVSEIEGALIPGLDIKAFDLDELAEAEAWLAQD